MNLYQIFRETAEQRGDQPAILGLGPDVALSYRRLDDTIVAAAEVLAQAGVRAGDCVGLHCPSGVDYIVSAYAIWRCGGCVVPVPAELADGEKQEICREISLDFVVSTQRGASFREPFRRGAIAEFLPGMSIAPVRGVEPRPAAFAAINSAFIRFTSGTTGSSKGVVLSHETIHERIMAANEVLHIGADDRVVWLLSMSYHFAVTIVGYLSLGAAIVLPANHFARAISEATQRHDATLIYGSPTHFAWLAECEPHVPLPSLRLAISTTAEIDPRAADKFHRRYQMPVTQALGIIEVGLPFINVDFAADRSAAVGRVLPAYRLRMEDVGLGDGLQEILLAGNGFLDAYYRPWRSRAEIMPDGWFRTGDVGELDADGCLFLRGRTKDVISVLGMKFFPREVEAVLASHPAVESACVVARRDERLGEVPTARVVAKADANGNCSARQLLDYCRERLASYKVPEQIEFVAALPRTASGKVLHREIGNRAP
jgi:long-chain acyl-CoA synthetase